MTNNLGAPTLTTSQSNKETTINDAIGQLDSAITEELAVTVSDSTEDYTISGANLQLYARFNVVETTGGNPAATSKIDLVFTAVQRYFTVKNNTLAPVHLYISTTHYGMVMPGTTQVVYCDGTDLFKVYDGELRDPVRVVSTANVTTSTALNSGDTIDGVTLANGDRVLLTAQSTAADNGVWIVAATPYKSGEPYEIGGRYRVTAGTYQNKSWRCTATTPSFSLDYYPFDLGVYVKGTPDASGDILVLNVTRPFKLPASLTGSDASLGTAPSGGAVAITVSKNGSSQGTVNFADAATTPTFTFSSEVSWAVGDTIELTTPSNLFSCADLAITLKGQLV